VLYRAITAFAFLTALLVSAPCAWAQDDADHPAEVESDREVDAAEGPALDAAHPAGAEHGEHEAGGHHDHIGEGGGVNTEPQELKGDLAIFTFIVFALLAAILWKFAWGPISAGLDKREKGIADEIAAAHAANEEARRMLAQYEQKLADAQVDVRGILDEARRDAEHTQQEILAKARDDARAERDRALREIETATQQALKELAEKSTDLAIELAGRIVRAELKPADHTRLISEAVSGFATPSKN
jgi:F-type H+-transporting ATPase subunit b